MLALPRLQGYYTVDTDAFDKQIGFVLLKKQPDRNDITVGNGSGSLDDAKPAYYTTHLECLAVVWAVIMLTPYLEGSQFTVQTDHDALE